MDVQTHTDKKYCRVAGKKVDLKIFYFWVEKGFDKQHHKKSAPRVATCAEEGACGYTRDNCPHWIGPESREAGYINDFINPVE